MWFNTCLQMFIFWSYMTFKRRKIQDSMNCFHFKCIINFTWPLFRKQCNQQLKIYLPAYQWLQIHPKGGGGGGHFHIDGDGDVLLDRVWFAVINIGTGYLNRPNWLLAGYSVYHRVASRASQPGSQPTMFMTGPRSRDQRPRVRDATDF